MLVMGVSCGDRGNRFVDHVLDDLSDNTPKTEMRDYSFVFRNVDATAEEGAGHITPIPDGYRFFPHAVTIHQHPKGVNGFAGHPSLRIGICDGARLVGADFSDNFSEVGHFLDVEIEYLDVSRGFVASSSDPEYNSVFWAIDRPADAESYVVDIYVHGYIIPEVPVE